MKKFIFFARVGALFILVLLQPAIGAHQVKTNPDIPYYVVIGAFAYENNAIKFTQQANAQNFHAQFDLQPQRKLFYVYVLSTADRDAALAEGLRLRKESKYYDTWVFHGIIGHATPEQMQTIGTDINPENEKPLNTVTAEEHKAISEDSAEETVAETPAVTEPVKTRTEEKLSAEEIEGRNFIFELYRAVDNQKVEGEVDEIDVEKSRKMASYKANEPVKVSAPAGKSGAVTFVCQVFGYRKTQRDFSFAAAGEQGVTVDQAGNIIMPFELIRLQKGDIAVMYNVYFYKDAAVMRPESRFEVNNLMEMLKENPGYKIKIHGHTNGNSHGKIITMGDQKNFFSLTDTRDGFGSAKKLSFERASAIKEFLVTNGVDEKRMLIKAWGGKRPIHDKNATRAQENVRVEIEILEH